MIASLWVACLVGVSASFWKDKRRTLDALRKSGASLKKLSPGLLAMILLVGLILSAVSEENIAALFRLKGIWGFILVSFAGAVVTIPGPIAFPLAGELVERGASLSVLGTFITTLTMVGITTAPLEVSYFGFRFTVVRQALSLLAAIAIGLLMGVFL